jgi:hypothetical protein
MRYSKEVLRAKWFRTISIVRCMTTVRQHIASMSLPEARLHVDAVLAFAGPAVKDSSNDAAIQAAIMHGTQKREAL